MGGTYFDERPQFHQEPTVLQNLEQNHHGVDKFALNILPGLTTYRPAGDSDQQSTISSDDNVSVADSVFDTESIASSQSSYGSSGSDSAEDSSDGESAPKALKNQRSVSQEALKKLTEQQELLSGISAQTTFPQSSKPSDRKTIQTGHSQQEQPEQSHSTVSTKSHRRRSAASESVAAPPCRLKRDTESADCFVMLLITFATKLITSIWPLSACPPMMSSCFNGAGVLPLEVFIHETLRRSKTSYSTLQVALYYLILLKCNLPDREVLREQGQTNCRAMQCGRRMFLAALMLASKYLQDRNYSTRAWSKISGLRICEINENEMEYLKRIDYSLHMRKEVFENWSRLVLCLSKLSKRPAGCSAFAKRSYDHPQSRLALSAMIDDVGQIGNDDIEVYSTEWWVKLLDKLDRSVCQSAQSTDQFLRDNIPSGDVSDISGRANSALNASENVPEISFSDSPSISSASSTATKLSEMAASPARPPTTLPLRPQPRNLPTPISTPRGPDGCPWLPNADATQASPQNLRCSASVDALRNVRKQCLANATLERCPPPRPQSYHLPPTRSLMRPAASSQQCYSRSSTPLSSSPASSVTSDVTSRTCRSRSSSISSNSSMSSWASGPAPNLRFGVDKPQEPSPLTRVVSMPETRVPNVGYLRSVPQEHPLRRKPQFSDIGAARRAAASYLSAQPFYDEGYVSGEDLTSKAEAYARSMGQEVDAAAALLRLSGGQRESHLASTVSHDQSQLSLRSDASRGHKRTISHTREAQPDLQAFSNSWTGNGLLENSMSASMTAAEEPQRKWQLPSKPWALPRKPVSNGLDTKRMALYCASERQMSAPELAALRLKDQSIAA